MQHLEAKLRQEPVSGVRKRSRDAFVVQSAFARAAPIELSDAGELWRRYVRQGDAMEHRVRIRFDDGLGGRDKEIGRMESTPQPMIPCVRGGGERERRGGVGEAARGLLRATVARDSSASSSSSSSDGNRRHSRQKPEDKPTSVRTVAPSRPPAAAAAAVASKKVQVPSSSSPERRSPVQRRVEGGGSARGMLQQGQSKRTGGARTITEEEEEEEEIIPASCRSWTRRSSNRTKVTFQKLPTPGEEDKAKDEIKAGKCHLLRNEEEEEETMADLRSEVEQLKRMLSRSLAEKEQSKVESLTLNSNIRQFRKHFYIRRKFPCHHLALPPWPPRPPPGQAWGFAEGPWPSSLSGRSSDQEEEKRECRRHSRKVVIFIVRVTFWRSILGEESSSCLYLYRARIRICIVW